MSPINILRFHANDILERFDEYEIATEIAFGILCPLCNVESNAYIKKKNYED